MISSLASLPVLLAAMLAPAQPLPTPDDLQGEAWLITHGIYTSQWKDPACKALALELADETTMTALRLAWARQLAENAGVVQFCDPASGQTSQAIPPTNIGMDSCGNCDPSNHAIAIGNKPIKRDMTTPAITIGMHSCGMCGDEETYAIGGGPSIGPIGSREQSAFTQQARNELDNRLLRLEVDEANWTDEVCQAAAEELANIPEGEAAGADRIEAAYALIDRASTVRNCRVAGDHMEADVGAFSDAPNACTSTLYLYPWQSPFVKRLCPIGEIR